MVGRACCGSERFHLLDEERNERLGVEDGLCLLIEICLVGGAAALSHEQELVLVAFCGVYVDLGREVAAGVHLFIHGQRRVLRVAEIVFGVSLVYAVGNLLLVVASRPYLLAFVCRADACAGVLAERKHAFG